MLCRLLPALTSAVFVVTACGGGSPPPTPPSGAGASEVTCEGSVSAGLEEIFDRSFAESVPTGCAAMGCHGSGAGGLRFRDAHGLWAAVVGKPSKSGVPLVTPGDPANSAFLLKLLPGTPNRMPGRGPYLYDADES